MRRVSLPINMLSLLFSATRELLGEVHIQQGALSRVTLTERGESFIGPQVLLWQTRGVPMRKEMDRVLEDGSSERIVFTDYIHTNDARFSAALERWCHQYQMAVLTLSNEMIPCWEMLAQLPFEQEERFAFLIAIQHTPTAHLDEWRHSLQEAQVLISHHRDETRRAIDHVKARMSRSLLHPFTHTHDTNSHSSSPSPSS